MNTFRTRFKKFFARRRNIYIALGVVVILLIMIVKGNKADPNVTLDTVKRQDLSDTVLATGQVTSLTDLELSFNSSGAVRSLPVNVGDVVKKGQILASLDQGSALAGVTQARGALAAAQAKYRKVVEGSSSEEIRLAQIQLENAKNSPEVQNARRTLYSSDLIADPYDQSQSSTAPVITGTYIGTDAGEYRISFVSTGTYTARYSGLEQGTIDVGVTPRALGTRGLTISFADGGYSLNDTWKVLVPNTNGAHYTTNLNAYNAAVEAAASLVKQRQAELDLKLAQARPADLDLAQADVLSAQGQLQSAQAVYENTVIRAPADGTITSVDTKLGELAQANTPVITLKDVEHLYLEAKINESNITKIKLNQVVTFTVDAFGPTRTFSGEVIHVDPGATVDEGVINYKINISLLDADPAIRTGMNANLTILVSKDVGVLVVPGLAVSTHGGKSYVNLVTDAKHKKYIEHEVVTGATGDGNLIEIKSGLTEGNSIALIKE